MFHQFPNLPNSTEAAAAAEEEEEEITIHPLDPSLDAPRPDSEVCIEHNRTPFGYFCTSHWCLCCSDCTKPGGPHSACNFAPLECLEAPLLKKDIKKRSKKLARDVESAQETIDYITSLSQDRLGESIASAREAIVNEFNIIREAVNKKEQEILQKLEDVIDEHGDSFNTAMEAFSAAAQKGIEHYKAWDEHTQNENIAAACNVKHESDRFHEAVSQKICDLCDVLEVSVKAFSEHFVEEISKIESFSAEKRSFNVVPTVKETADGKLSIGWDPAFFNCAYQIVQKKEDSSFEEVYDDEEPRCDLSKDPNQRHVSLFARIKIRDFSSKWSGPFVLKATPPNACWASCPDNVSESMKYTLSDNSFVVSKDSNGWSTVIGENYIHGTKKWGIRVVNSKDGDSEKIFVGVAPYDIDQNADNNFCKCGWYLDCYGAVLWSGAPHNYREKPTDVGGSTGRYVRDGGRVGVTMDAEKGTLSFSLDDGNVPNAFEGIPLDKPLAPCVVFCYRGDSIEYLEE